MGLVTSALQIGKSALMAYQSALQVVGNNISNSGSTSYTRQTAVLTPAGGVYLPEGFTPGGGVTLSALKRNVDATLEDRIRHALSDQSDATAQQDSLGRIESILNELSDTDLSSALQSFFNAFSALQNNPENSGARGIVLTSAQTLVAEIKRQRSDVLGLRDELNVDIADAASQISDFARKIADLNSQIVDVESSSNGGAGSLRDQRDDLLKQLSQIVEIEVREQPSGTVNVYIGNEPLIQDGINRGITTTLDMNNGVPQRVVRFADNNSPVNLVGGRIAGLVTARDEHAMGYVDSLDGLAVNLINVVNVVHSQGQGLAGITDMTGSYDVLDPAAALNSGQAGLDLKPVNGSFQITVRDRATGAENVATITVDLDGVGSDDSLNSLAAQINAKVGNLTATVTSDRRLKLTAASGSEFVFGNDSSQVLASLGINTFFTGADAQDIAVNTTLTGNPQLLAAATSSAEGDGTNAGALAALADIQLASLNGQSITDFYNDIATNVGVKSAASKAGMEAADAINTTLSSQREAISGVSLDEETIEMLRLERAFQGAARYASTVDQLIQETLQLIG